MGIFDDKTNRIILFLAFLLILELQLVFRSNNTTSIQNKNKSEIVKTTINNKKEPETITLLLGGDVMLGRSVMQEALKNGGYPYLFEKISNFTKDADIFFVNLENPIIEDCPVHTGGFKFCASPQAVDGLVSAGVDVVTLANNHSANFGTEGLKETKKYLEDSNILVTGLGNAVIMQYNNITILFLSFDFTVNSPTDADYQLISDSNTKADYLVIGVHWGTEYQAKANKYQKVWAGEMVKNGADIIVGHHPHWVQDFEYINNNPVYYSLGNLVFDQMWSEETKKGMLVQIELEKSGIINEERFNTYMAKLGQPEIVNTDISN